MNGFHQFAPSTKRGVGSFSQSRLALRCLAVHRDARARHPDLYAIGFVGNFWPALGLGGEFFRANPFHTRIEPNKGQPIAAAIHAAHGGPHDAPTPGDILCAALGVCQELTLRMVANVMGIELEALEVETTGEVDVRASLGMGGKVGFQSMRCRVRLRAKGATAEQVSWLCAAAEKLCIVGDTLRSGVAVDVEFSTAS